MNKYKFEIGDVVMCRVDSPDQNFNLERGFKYKIIAMDCEFIRVQGPRNNPTLFHDIRRFAPLPNFAEPNQERLAA